MINRKANVFLHSQCLQIIRVLYVVILSVVDRKGCSVTTVTSGNTKNAILVSLFFILFNLIYIYMLRTKYLSIVHRK